MKGRGSAMEAEEESVKDKNWLPRPIPELSKGEEFYSISNTDMIHLEWGFKSPELRVSDSITYSQISPCSDSQLLEAPAGDFSSQVPCQHRANKLCS